jgi:penicillin-binding protein 1A
MVRQEMVARYGEETAYSAGLQVFTTVNSKQQTTAKLALQQNLYDYDERHGYRGPVAQLWQSKLRETADTEPVFEQTEPFSVEEITAYLDKQSSIEQLQPAVVTAVNVQTATVIIAGGQQVELTWDGLKWARSFITDERQAVAPKTAFAILAPGMHILVRQQDNKWRLSQVPQASSAMVAIDPQNGAIRALVGGYSFGQSQFNRVTQAKRQVGSNIKPFIYSAALEHGYTLASIMNDAPIHQWDDNAGIAWRPKNSPAVYDGPIRIREALAKSKNVVSVRLLRGVGIDNMIQHLQRFGFAASDLPRNETLALGSASLTPLELVTGYAAFANGGYRVTPYVINKVLSEDGELLFQHAPAVACRGCGITLRTEHAPAQEPALDTEAQLDQLFDTLAQDSTAHVEPPATVQPNVKTAEQAISEHNSFLIADALTSSIWGGGSWQHGTGWNGTARQLQSLKRRDISAKTGTTNDSKDTWFSGFTPHLAVTVWVGFDDANRSLGRAQWHANMGQQQSAGAESGARTALPAWLDYMQSALNGVTEQQIAVPVGLASVRIDVQSGLLSRRTDYTSTFEYFKPGTEPAQYAGNDVQQISFDKSRDNQQDEQQEEELELF